MNISFFFKTFIAGFKAATFVDFALWKSFLSLMWLHTGGKTDKFSIWDRMISWPQATACEYVNNVNMWIWTQTLVTFSHRLQLETQINGTVFEQCYIHIELKERSSWSKLDLHNVDPEQTQQTHCLCVSVCFCSNVSDREDSPYKPLQIHFGKSFRLSLSILSDILMQAFPWRQRSFEQICFLPFPKRCIFHFIWEQKSPPTL